MAVTVNDTANSLIQKVNSGFSDAGVSASFAHTSAGNDFVGGLNEAFGQSSETISASDTGNDFVGKLNTNLGNLTPSETTVVSMKMQAGQLENGYSKEYGAINSNTYSTSDYWNYIHSSQLLDIHDCVINSVSTQSGETLSIHWFDGDCVYGGSVGSVSDIPYSAKYVRLQLNKSSIAVRELAVTVTGTPATRKNAPNPQLDSVSVPDKRTYISYEVKQHDRFETSENYFSSRYYDNGFILLPDTYTPTGEPTKLAVFIQGTSGYPFNRLKQVNASYNFSHYMDYYREPQDFLAMNGYAVCCCSGSTSRYGNNVINLYYAPLFCESVASMVEWIKANYNIGEIYIYGKSSGGLLCNLPSLVTEIGAVCVGSLAPALSPLAARVYRSDSACEQLGVHDPNNPSSYYHFVSGAREWLEADKQVVYNNIGKFREYDAFFSTNDMTDENLEDVIASCYTINNSYDKYGNIYNAYNGDNDVKSLLDASTRAFPVPIRTWIAKDDASVTYMNVELLRGATNRYYGVGNERFFISELSRSTGGHHADYYDSNAEKETRDGVTFAKAYWGLVDWFNCKGIETNNN